MIASFFDGRVRLRCGELKDPAAMDLVMGFIRSQDGIHDLTPNLKTGSLVVTYDPEKIPREALFEAAAALEKKLGHGKKPAAGKRTAKKARTGVVGPLAGLSPLAESGLLAALYGLTLVTGFTDKRAHLAGAGLFTALLAAHVYCRKKWLE